LLCFFCSVLPLSETGMQSNGQRKKEENPEPMNDDNNEQENIISGDNFDQYLAACQASVGRLCRFAEDESRVWNNRDDFAYYKLSCDHDTFVKPLNQLSERLLNLVEKQTNHLAWQYDVEKEKSGGNGQQIPAQLHFTRVEVKGQNDCSDLFEENIHKFSEHCGDTIDSLLEKVDIYSDRVKAAFNRGDDTRPFLDRIQQQSSTTVSSHVSNDAASSADAVVTTLGNILRPQLKFPDAVDNSTFPFVPKILEKPNAQVPLDPIIERMQKEEQERNGSMKNNQLLQNDSGAAPPRRRDEATSSSASSSALEHVWSENGIEIPTYPSTLPSAPHPYQYELDHLIFRSTQLEKRPAQSYQPLDSTPLSFVDTPDKLVALVDTLCSEKEFAVDLEHHSYRSFQGFTCLMQISTRQHDYIVDTLALRGELYRLNKPFTDPLIVKVFHGAESDIVWLQRDFGVYVVNMFDTGQAARVLEKEYFSLAFLLKFYCNVRAQKQFQLADWRVRPLSSELIHYARQDTHYLLYIYDQLRNELITRGNENNNLLRAVLRRSTEVCKRRYEKVMITPIAHEDLYNRSSLQFNASQMRVFIQLFRWRDTIAREADESVRYVLPNHLMFQIAEKMPETADGIFACCTTVPPSVRLHSDMLIQLIQLAKRNPNVSSTSCTITSGGGGDTPVLSKHTNTPLSRGKDPNHTNRYQHADKGIDPKDLFALSKSSVLPHAATNAAQLRAQVSSPVFTTDQLYRTARWIPTDAQEIREDGVSETLEAQIPSSQKRRALRGSLFLDGTKSRRTTSMSDDTVSSTEALVDQINASFDLSTTAAPQTFAGGDSRDAPSDTAPDKSDVSLLTPTDPAMKEKVPRSIADIYHLSNLNRKQNRKNKKLKDDHQPAPPNDANKQPLYNNFAEQHDRHARQQHEAADTSTSKHAFMRDIGWVSADAPSPPNTPTQEKTTQKSNSGGSNKKSSNKRRARHRNDSKNNNEQFEGFDYSKSVQSSSGRYGIYSGNKQKNTSSSSSSTNYQPYQRRGGGGGKSKRYRNRKKSQN